jgi:hypothetical protein
MVSSSTFLLIACLTALPVSAADEVDFARDVRPILSNRCFKCHGPDVRKRDLRFDRRGNATAKLESGERAVVPGDSDASELLRRVTSNDPGKRMPPEGNALTDHDIDVLRRWIESGAPYADHWANLKPRHPRLPAVRDSGWPESGLDHFILARLEESGLSVAPEADRATLIRRLSLDLIGLLPSVEDVDAFVADTHPDAYRRLVDRLLGSPHFGERWARWWLDLARYGDTNGYEDDQPRPIWPYRDWVINTLNRNNAFDRFSIEQIAGDLIENASPANLIATGFHRNSLINTENGSSLDEWKDSANKDRVNTLFTIWMGTTIECAQCHNHKFDPITQEDYYRVYAFFNSTTDLAGKGPDDVWLTDTVDVFFGDEKRLAALENDKRETVLKFDERSKSALLDRHFHEWRSATRARIQGGELGWHVQAPTSVTSRDGTTLTVLDDHSILSSGELPEREVYTVRFRSDLESVRALRLEALTHEDFTHQSLSRGDNGNFVLTGVEIEVRPPGDEAPKAVKIAVALADYSQKSHDIALAIDGKRETGWAVDGDTRKENCHAFFAFSEPIRGGRDTEYTVRIASDSSNHARFVPGRVRLSLTRHDGAPSLDAGPPPEIVGSLLQAKTDARIDDERRYFAAHTPVLAGEREEVERAKNALQEFRQQFTSQTMVIHEGEYKLTHVQKRGNYLDPSHEVEPGVPSCFDLPLRVRDGRRPSRIELAEWIMHPDNPRTARVTVNRLWDAIFGRGFVSTSEDFGMQGALPTHPRLLDWLATEFVRKEWNLKALLRTIVTSAAYRQSSVVDSEKRKIDPDNALLSRGARYRVEAEMLRDIHLVASGLLTYQIGGASTFPPQPKAIWESLFVANGYKSWPESKDGNRYRRGLYTYIKRTALHPVMRNFDATNRTNCVVRRNRSNTPLAALTTMNEKSSIEAAAGLACRMLGRPERGGPVGRLVHGFRICVSRQPREDEREALLRLYTRVVEGYRKDPESASWLVESAFHVKPRMRWKDAELAAWIVVANTLLNMDSTLSRG